MPLVETPLEKTGQTSHNRGVLQASAMTDFLLVLSTFPTPEKAREAGRVLVGEKLAACVNILPGLTSIYVWQDEACEDAETLVLIKTRREHYLALESRLRELHPYETPEIVAVDIAAGLPAYLRWIADNTARSVLV